MRCCSSRHWRVRPNPYPWTGATRSVCRWKVCTATLSTTARSGSIYCCRMKEVYLLYMSLIFFDVACFLAHVVGSSAGQVQWSRWPSHRGRVILFSTEVSLLVVQTEPPVYIQNYKYTMMCGRIKVGRHIHNYIVPESVSFIINYRAEGLER